MKPDPILQEVHAMKDQVARKVRYDLHTYCEMLRQASREHPERMAPLKPSPVKVDGKETRKPL